LRSVRKLQKDLGASPTTITAAIRWLEENKKISTEPTELGTIFTVLSFDVYQGNQKNERYPNSNTRYSDSNTPRYSDSNNTKNYNSTKNYKEKEDSVDNLYSVKGVEHDERNTSLIDWERYPHLRF
jgi:DNA-binding transcriptional MocR family regulator